jgi:hypothetical protein
MTNMLNQLAGLPRLAKTKFLLVLAVTAVVIAATFVHADSGGNKPEGNSLAGTWLKDNEPGVQTPLLTTYLSDGSLIASRCVIVPTGPASVALVSTGHGEWIRTGHNEFAATTFFISSGPTVEFTGLVKRTETIKLNRAADQFLSTATVYIYDAANNLLFSFPDPSSGVTKRVIVGQ